MNLERLKILRKEKKVTQGEIAKVLGVARTTYANYEQGTRQVDNKTLNKLADFFNVTEQTINNWKLAREGFFESLKKGKLLADAKVASALYHRALGYEHEEDKIFQFEGEPVIVPTIKHYPPDTTAAIFWLKNRRPSAWRDRQDINVTGDMSADVSAKIEEIRAKFNDKK